MIKKDADFVIIGGGIVGLSLAHGLLKQGVSVICIDGEDTDFRASRGNFGLVWVQGKGIKKPFYAAWTRDAARLYPNFVSELSEETGIKINLSQNGGYEYFTDSKVFDDRIVEYENLKKELNNDYPYEILSSSEIRAAEPMVGGKTIGATFYPHDGHLNPLQLLKALTEYCRKRGLLHYLGEVIEAAEKKEGIFRLVTKKGLRVSAEKVVVCAGLGAKKIGPLFGFMDLVTPQRGQILITEKLPPILNRPSVTIRQTNEGAIQIGDSQEQVGFNDNETQVQMSLIAQNAIRVMPKLAQLRLVRAWGSLRVMSPDGLPIYQQSESMPGAFIVTCHSGITLSAIHSAKLAPWLIGQKNAPDLSLFSESRFHA